MTNSQPHIKKPSPRQLRYLKDLALKSGVSFTYPQTAEQADREIKRLLKRKRSPRDDRRRGVQAVRRAMAESRGGAAAVRDHELRGYGSSATWS